MLTIMKVILGTIIGERKFQYQSADTRNYKEDKKRNAIAAIIAIAYL